MAAFTVAAPSSMPPDAYFAIFAVTPLANIGTNTATPNGAEISLNRP